MRRVEKVAAKGARWPGGFRGAVECLVDVAAAMPVSLADA